jgi:imidazolonepropionase-like amidohydrolase
MNDMDLITTRSIKCQIKSIGADDVGTIEPGKWGDLVIFTKNPAEDIMNTKTIESVWIAGNRME